MSRSGSVIAIIPARGGSKRIPRKNVLPVGGAPLVVHSIRHALAAQGVDEVIVSTEDPEVAEVARGAGAEVFPRPPDLATDQATTESALIDVLGQRREQGRDDPDLVVLLQATSPVRGAGDVDAALAALSEQGADSLLSVTRDRRFIWRSEGGEVSPLNYDPTDRPREQDLPPQFQENGSIYVSRADELQRVENRLHGRIGIYEMPYWTAFQIDEPEDVELVEWILGRPEYRAEPPWPARLEAVAFDFDGVMTDNTVIVSDDGREAVTAHRGDGWGLARLRERGLRLVVVSTETNPVVAARCEKLGLSCIQGLEEKEGELAAYLEREGVDPQATAFVGNDVNDLGSMAIVGLPVAVRDADTAVRAAAKLVLSRPGGRGAVRELCDRIITQYG